MLPPGMRSSVEGSSNRAICTLCIYLELNIAHKLTQKSVSLVRQLEMVDEKNSFEFGIGVVTIIQSVF